MKEIIFINLGQAGVQLSESIWDKFTNYTEPHNQNILFRETSNKPISPRCIIADLDPETINSLKLSTNRLSFNDSNLISGSADSSNIYSKANLTLGKVLIDQLTERLRHESEHCDSLQGFIITHSVGGGTGSGLNPLLLEELNDHYDVKARINLTIFPSACISPVILEPYNTVLGLDGLKELCDACFIQPNQILFDICKQKLGMKKILYEDINELVAHSLYSIIGSAVNGGSLNLSLNELVENLVMGNKKFLTNNLSHIIQCKDESIEDSSVSQITQEIFDPVFNVDKNGTETFFAACLMFKGNVVPQDVRLAGIRAKEKMKFGKQGLVKDWVGFDDTKVIHKQAGCYSKSVCLIKNSTDVCGGFDEICQKFDSLFKRRAYVHWYIKEGLSEEAFHTSRNSIQEIIQDYKKTSP